MDQINEFVDERQRSWCIHCGGWIAALDTNRDHVPSKSLLQKPYPANLPVVDVCTACNGSFSLDEEYLVAFLGAVLAGKVDPDRQINPNAKAILARNERLRTRIDRAKKEFKTHGGETRIVWTPEQDRIARVLVKNARGHALYEIGEPMLREPAHVWMAPLESLTVGQKSEFETTQRGANGPKSRGCLGVRVRGKWAAWMPGAARGVQISTNAGQKLGCVWCAPKRALAGGWPNRLGVRGEGGGWACIDHSTIDRRTKGRPRGSPRRRRPEKRRAPRPTPRMPF